MYIRISNLFLLLLCTICACAQILPAPGSKLNYNQIMFEYDKVPGASVYQVQVAVDEGGSSFKNCVAVQKDSATATMISGLAFGKKYKWRYTGIKAGKKPEWHGPYDFEIVADTFISKNIFSLKIIKKDTSNRGLIIMDGTHTIVDRNGNLVWYLTNVDWIPTTKTRRVTEGNLTKVHNDVTVGPNISDLRVTDAGTITYLKDSVAAECALNGNTLWRAPNDGQVNSYGSESYNHDFKRLANGHYMVLGNELWRKLPAYADTEAIDKKFVLRTTFNGAEYVSTEYGTVIEYDKTGKVVWSWRSSTYLDKDILKPASEMPYYMFTSKPHINAFSTDQKNEFVYVGFRDICRIVKVEKSSGKVVDSWGMQFPTGEARHRVELHGQHDANILPDDNIAVFNNNDYQRLDSFANVIIISQQPADSGKVIWRFDCDFDIRERTMKRNGGNVDQLKNGNYLVCMGNQDRIFEVTKSKQVVWLGEIKQNQPEAVTYTHRLYRAHYVSSLYPCYFTFYTDADTVGKEASNFNIRLFNKGSEDDGYVVKVSVAGDALKQFTTNTLRAGSSTRFFIEAGKPLNKGQIIEVGIQSVTNPDFVRKRVVVVR